MSEWLNTSGAADYLSLRLDTFRRKVRAGVIPAPSYSIGEKSPRWSRSELDAMMTPQSSCDINSTVDEIVSAIKASKQKSRPRR